MSGPAAAATAQRETPRVRPGAVLRQGGALLATAWAAAALQLGAHPRAVQGAWSRRVLAALRVRTVLAGPIPTGARLWAANHISWLDPLVLLGLRPCGVLAKAEVASYPLVGPAARAAGLRFVDRGGALSRAAALAAMAAELRRGEDFLLFPEGTTTRGRHLGSLHTGGLLAAHRLGVPTLPLRLECDATHYPWVGDMTLLPHLADLAEGPPVQVRVVPGPRLDPRDWTDPYEWVAKVRRDLAPRPNPELEPPI